MKNEAASNKSNIFIYLILVVFAAVSIVFFGWILISSFKTTQELFQNVWSLPEKLQFGNFSRAWTVGHFNTFFINSILVTVVSVGVTIFLSCLASYVLARFSFKGSTFFHMLFVFGLAIPVPLIFIPLYLLLNNMGLTDSLIGLIIVYIALIIPFSVFLLTEYMRVIPKEIEECAILEGSSDFYIFWKIILPLSMPGVITVAILNIFAIWNEFFIALVLVTDVNKATVPLGLAKLQAMQIYGGEWTVLFAGVIISLIPTVILFFFMQSKIVSGLTAGALKE